jgi:hypothetical protein
VVLTHAPEALGGCCHRATKKRYHGTHGTT